MGSLHDAGWRQGTIVGATLPLVGVRLTADGAVVPDERSHSLWIIATQDCDLARFDSSLPDDVVELRPVFDHNPPRVRGIRSMKCLLAGKQYVDAQSRRVMMPPAALTSILVSSVAAWRDNGVAEDENRKTAFKTWLGLRYDRPAVPPEHTKLATRIAEELERKGRDYTAMVRDVLVQFSPGDPTTYSLFAIVVSTQGAQEVDEWLTNATLRVPAELGVLASVDVGTDEQASLRLLETSFAVDLTQITFVGEALHGEAGRLSRPIQVAGLPPDNERRSDG